jgi:hypothetical protein
MKFFRSYLICMQLQSLYLAQQQFTLRRAMVHKALNVKDRQQLH